MNARRAAELGFEVGRIGVISASRISWFWTQIAAAAALAWGVMGNGWEFTVDEEAYDDGTPMEVVPGSRDLGCALGVCMENE